MKTVLIFLAEGFEEIEAVTCLDLLRRVGVNAKFVSITGNYQVTGAHNAIYRADMLFDGEKAKDADAIVLPGGLPGAHNLLAHEGLHELILYFHEKKKSINAICASPMILGAHGILSGRSATIYPGMEAELIGATPVSDTVCTDGHITTSQGPATSFDFALRIVKNLMGDTVKEELMGDLLYRKA